MSCPLSFKSRIKPVMDSKIEIIPITMKSFLRTIFFFLVKRVRVRFIVRLFGIWVYLYTSKVFLRRNVCCLPKSLSRHLPLTVS